MAYDKGKLEGLKEREFVEKYKWQKVIELPKFRYIYPLQEIKLKLDKQKYPKQNS